MKIFNKLITLLFLLFIVLSLYTGSVIYEDNPNTDIYNKTENVFNITKYEAHITQYNQTKHQNNFVSQRTLNMISYTIEYIGKLSSEIMKTFVEIGFNSKGKYNYIFLIRLIQIAIWILLLIPAIFGSIIIFLLTQVVYEQIKKIYKKIKNGRK